MTEQQTNPSSMSGGAAPDNSAEEAHAAPQAAAARLAATAQLQAEEDAEAAGEPTTLIAEVTETVQAAAEVVTAQVGQAAAAAGEALEGTFAAAQEAVAAGQTQAGALAEAAQDAAAGTFAAAQEAVSAGQTQAGALAEAAQDAAAGTFAAAQEAVAAGQTQAGALAEAAQDAAADTFAAGQAQESTATESTQAATPSESILAQEPGGKRVVRTLSVGQEIVGTVKRTTDFGAFVDIGVGRDGLVHISELSIGRVQKVTDMLQEGQEVTVWIKKLDRNRNRISLTMISPDTKTVKDLNEGDTVQGTVTRIVPYGAFVDVGVGRDALLHIREMSAGYVNKPEDVVKAGDTIEARISALNRRRGRIDLSLKGLGPEPEPAPAVAAPSYAPTKAVVEEPYLEEDDNTQEVLSPMELAFKKAMEAEGIEMQGKRNKKGKRSKRHNSREIQDEIIARTLDAIHE